MADTIETRYQVLVKTAGDADWIGNLLRYRTREEAENEGASLAWRWTAVREWKVEPIQVRVDDDGVMHEIPGGA